MTNLNIPEDKLQLALSHPGRRRMFDSMQTYDPKAAWRYIHFCCSPIDDAEESKKDCQLLLDVLPDREKDAIALNDFCWTCNCYKWSDQRCELFSEDKLEEVDLELEQRMLIEYWAERTQWGRDGR